MAKKRSITISDKNLGIALIVALIIEYVFPRANLEGFSSVATLIYLLVAIYLLFLA